MNPYQKSLFPEKTKSATQAQLDAKRSEQRKGFLDAHPIEERDQKKAEAVIDLKLRGKQSPYAQTEFGSKWLTTAAYKQRTKDVTKQIDMAEKFSALPDDEKTRFYPQGRPQGWTPASHKKTVSNYNAIRRKEAGTQADITNYWKEEGVKSAVEMREQKDDISNYWAGMASESRKEISKDKETKDKAKLVASEAKAKSDKTFLDNNKKAIAQRLGGYNVPVIVDGKKTTKFVPYKSAGEAGKAKESILRADYEKKTPLARQLTDALRKKKPYNETKQSKKGLLDKDEVHPIFDAQGNEIGKSVKRVKPIEEFGKRHPILSQFGSHVKQGALKPLDDLLAGREARKNDSSRGFLYGGGLQPVNVTKANPLGEFPKKSGRPAKPRRKDPVGGRELAFFGKPFGAPKAPRRTRRGRVIKMTAAQRKRASRKPKSFLDDVFGGKW
jgi:hypothetical protein